MLVCDLQVITKDEGRRVLLIANKTLLPRQMYFRDAIGGDMATKAKPSKRELIDTGKDKRYIRRDRKGRFDEDEVVDVGRSLAQDVRHDAKKKVPPGQGDRGDQETGRNR